MYSADPDFLSPELVSSMSQPRERASIHDFRSIEGTPTQGAIMTRSRSVTDPNPPPSPGTKNPALTKDGGLGELKVLKHPPRDAPQTPPDDVQLLPSELTCVGLSDELGVDNWGLKIVKLVAFPDLILAARPLPSSPSSLTTPSLYSSENASSSIFDFSPPVVREISSSSSSSSSSSEDDGYFSHSPPQKPSPSFTSLESQPYSELKDETPSSLYEPPSKHLAPSLLHPSPVKPKITTSNDSSTKVTPSTGGSQVPFFSYTKTPEGCSLTADVYILATLFPPHERHMVICSGELDAADERLASGTESSDDENEEDDDPSYSLGSALKCLQIDLQRFGLGVFNYSTTSKKYSDGYKIRQSWSREPFLTGPRRKWHQPHV